MNTNTRLGGVSSWQRESSCDLLWKSWLLLTITLINNYTTYKSIHYSTYITYNLIWYFYTEQKKRERKATYNAFSKQVRIKDKTKIIQKIV